MKKALLSATHQPASQRIPNKPKCSTGHQGCLIHIVIGAKREAVLLWVSTYSCPRLAGTTHRNTQQQSNEVTTCLLLPRSFSLGEGMGNHIVYCILSQHYHLTFLWQVFSWVGGRGWGGGREVGWGWHWQVGLCIVPSSCTLEAGLWHWCDQLLMLGKTQNVPDG